MFIERRLVLQPLIESSQGVHLTAYLHNRGDVGDLKQQLFTACNSIREHLNPIMKTDAVEKFFEPIDHLSRDARVFQKIKGNVGIFRTPKYFRILSIPVDVEPQWSLADTFHVKPLLKWLQVEKDFLYLDISEAKAKLYFGNYQNLQHLDTLSLETHFDEEKNAQPGEQEIVEWLNQWLKFALKFSSLQIFVGGETEITRPLVRRLRNRRHITVHDLGAEYQGEDVHEVAERVHELQVVEAQENLAKVFAEYSGAEQKNLASKNVYHIAKAITRGEVSKLIVADGMSIYGRHNRKTGDLSIHPFDLDHEDDDILDDLAQATLVKGGEVFIAPLDAIPEHRPILAILHGRERQDKVSEDYVLPQFQAAQGYIDLPLPMGMQASKG